ncbi:hypothetical protein [Gorillibacterium sp. CAU 1737]|uniref:hypothetical protein n=1 Tax=Gorillibacterium sp. CAU 1737 TaxID=3140362 RepID=UPI0032600CEE
MSIGFRQTFKGHEESAPPYGLEKTLLLWIAGWFADCSFSWRELEQQGQAAGFSGAELVLGVSLLRLSGSLSFSRQGDGRGHYHLMPREVQAYHRHLRAAAASQRKEQPDPTDPDVEDEWGWCEGGRTPSSPQGSAADVFFRLLREVALNGLGNDLESGLRPKTASRFRKAVFGIGMAAAEPLAYERDTLDRGLRFLIEAARQLGILEPAKRGYCLEPNRLSAWLCLSEPEMNERLYRLWRVRGMEEKALLRHAVWLYDALPEAEVNGQELQELGLPASDTPSDAAHQVVERILKPLCLLGWAASLGGRFKLRLPNLRTETGHPLRFESPLARQEWYVQPDLEVIPIGVSSYSTLWELGRYAEPDERELGGTWKLTEKQWRHSVRLGGSTEHAFTLLAEYSLCGLPESVRQELAEWDREESRRSHSSHEPGSAKGSASAGQRMRGAIGAYPRVHTPWRGEESSEDQREELVFEEPAHSSMERAAVPGPDELFSGWRQVPLSWLKESRAYHPSTVEKLIACAIEWKARIRLDLPEEQEVVMIPDLVSREGDQSLLKGWCEGEEFSMRLSPEARLQVLLPNECFSWYDR